ncbi:YgaP-like transmembrane domain [Rhizobium terrae]
MAAWAICAGGAVFALTGIVGYCPICTVAGLVSGKRHD